MKNIGGYTVNYKKYIIPCSHCGEIGTPLVEITGFQHIKENLCLFCRDTLKELKQEMKGKN